MDSPTYSPTYSGTYSTNERTNGLTKKVLADMGISLLVTRAKSRHE